jgi:hypothetical protein
MIGPRASGPRNVAREAFGGLPPRERTVLRDKISSFDIAIRW